MMLSDLAFLRGAFVISSRCAAVFGVIVSVAVAAQLPVPARAADPAFVSLGAGYFDISKQDDGAADVRLEYRHDGKLWIFKPWAGIEATSDGAFYGGAGILLDVFFGRRVVVTPSLGAGYFEEGDGKDLGHELEFRSQIELAYRFDDRSRLGLAFSHISNASLGDNNPGAEILSLYYSMPLEQMLGE